MTTTCSITTKVVLTSVFLFTSPASSQDVDLPVRTVLDMLPNTTETREIARHPDVISAGTPGQAPIVLIGGRPTLRMEVQIAQGIPAKNSRAVTVHAFSPSMETHQTRTYFIISHPVQEETAARAGNGQLR